MTKNKGFSLIEIMVVIVILGLLATLILPNVLGSADQANKQKVRSDVIALENALSQYKLDNGVFPTTEQGLEALLDAPTTDPQPRNYRRGGYIQRLPQDPYGNDYMLLSPGEYGDIDIFSAGEDGQPGTDDDIGNWNLDQN
ncbi:MULTISPECIES: type II secretion system major pseudopilin GspG [Pseudidiomarina]|jgi:general secretion pathway protein G|uniref:Type II secretion system core protein G n=1 Tax=Pseudidiomarina atlantica TaxID=1517416 RepID=A0A094IPU4_9GAMM|nr:type II secretion system major pseudopilin GspG [Pseudidiomarina atlantica]KFZ29157.1 general secretion pathway protein GspG [Pseudidiomarina atlantica]